MYIGNDYVVNVADAHGNKTQLNVNIAFMRVFRHGRGRDAYMCIETDTPVTKEMQLIIRQLCKGITELFAV